MRWRLGPAKDRGASVLCEALAYFPELLPCAIRALITRNAAGVTREAHDATRTKRLVSSTAFRRSTARTVFAATCSAVCACAPGGRTPASTLVAIEFARNGVSTGPGRTTRTRT